MSITANYFQQLQEIMVLSLVCNSQWLYFARRHTICCRDRRDAHMANTTLQFQITDPNTPGVLRQIIRQILLEKLLTEAEQQTDSLP